MADSETENKMQKLSAKFEQEKKQLLDQLADSKQGTDKLQLTQKDEFDEIIVQKNTELANT